MTLAIGHGIGMPFGGHSFLPTDFSGCKLWLPAELGITLLSPKEDRAEWYELSGQFNHVRQVTAANKPSLSSRALEFDRVNSEHLDRSALTSLTGDYTIGIALQTTPTATEYHYCLRNSSGTDGQILSVDVSALTRRMTHAGVGNVDWGTATSSPERWIARYNASTTTADFCLNGSHQSSQSLGLQVAPTGDLSIGAHSNGAHGIRGKVWAAYIAASRLSDADTLLLDAWLAAAIAETALPAAPGTPIFKLERPDWYSGQAITDWANQGTETSWDLAQALVAKQLVLIPHITPAGGPAVHADGVDDFMLGTWTEAQPTHQFGFGLLSESAKAGSTIWDGSSGNTHRLYTSTNVLAYAGALLQKAGPALDDWHRLEVEHNGASGKLRVDDLSPTTGNIGTNDPDGLTLGAFGGGAANWGDTLIAEIIRYAGIRSAAEQAALHNWLKRHEA